MAADAGFGEDVLLPDTLQLAAATILYLAGGNADWLNGRLASTTHAEVLVLTLHFSRYYEASWDLGETERVWKDKILAGNNLVSKLSLP